MGFANVVFLDTTLLESTPTEDLTPRAVRLWLRDLPAGHLGQSTRQLYRVLWQVVRTPLSASDRFEILQMLDPHVDEATRALRRKLVHLAFPLPDRDIRIIELANDILDTALTGYRHILEDGRNTHWLLQPLRRDMWVASLHRLLRYYSLVLCNHRLLNQAAPAGLWQSIHQLYRSAAGAKWHKIPVADDRGEKELTIEQAYKQILLNAMLSHHQLRPDQIDDVVPLLDYFAGILVLRAPRPASDTAAQLCVMRGQDYGPVPAHVFGGVEQTSMLILDTTALRNELQAHLETGKATVGIGGGRLSRATIASLLRLWCETATPDDNAPASTRRVEVTLGLKNICQTLLDTLPRAEVPAADGCPVDAEMRQSPVFAPLCSRCDGRWGGTRLCESADILLDIPHTDNHPWQVAAPHSEPQAPLSAYMRNLAANRHELMIPALKTPSQLGNGGVVGIRNDAGGGWDVGQVTALCIESDHRWNLQIVPLISEALAVTARIERPNLPTLSLYGLIGSGVEGELVLLLPYRPVADTTDIVIDFQDYQARLTVTGNWCVTPSVMAFTVDEYDARETEPLPEEASPAKPAAAPIPPTATSAAEMDRYASLWNTL